MVVVIIVLILSIIIFRNTIGTSMAYITRTFIVWMIVTGILGAICNSLGLL